MRRAGSLSVLRQGPPRRRNREVAAEARSNRPPRPQACRGLALGQRLIASPCSVCRFEQFGAAAFETRPASWGGLRDARRELGRGTPQRPDRAGLALVPLRDKPLPSFTPKPTSRAPGCGLLSRAASWASTCRAHRPPISTAQPTQHNQPSTTSTAQSPQPNQSNAISTTQPAQHNQHNQHNTAQSTQQNEPNSTSITKTAQPSATA